MAPTTVLLVDDFDDIRMILRRALKSEVQQILECANGFDALTLARRHRPDLILLDLGLPGLDGWETARRIRAEPMLEHVPILGMTAYSMQSAVRAALLVGFQNVMFKPFDVQDVRARVRHYLSQSRDHPAEAAVGDLAPPTRTTDEFTARAIADAFKLLP